MRKWAIAAVLLTSCAVASAQESTAPKPAETKSSGSWYSWMWPFGEKTPAKKAPEAPKKAEPSAIDLAAARQASEETALNRRNEVILKLKEIALRTHDEALGRKAEQLEERAWGLYIQKTGEPGQGEKR